MQVKQHWSDVWRGISVQYVLLVRLNHQNSTCILQNYFANYKNTLLLRYL